jgi:hypothetical protein
MGDIGEWEDLPQVWQWSDSVIYTLSTFKTHFFVSLLGSYRYTGCAHGRID